MIMLVDTNVMIDYLRRSPAATRYLGALKNKPAASVVSIMELYAGARSRNEETRIDRLAASTNLIPVEFEIARSAGQFVKHFQQSHGMDDLDAIIAATAEHHGLELATLNPKHFPMFPRLTRPY